MAVPTDEGCGVSNFPEGTWTSVHADLFCVCRAQFLIPQFHAPDQRGEKHTPYITLNDDGTASVLMGKVGGDIYPMIA